MMEAINGFEDGSHVYFRRADGTVTKVRAEYAMFVRAAQVSPDVATMLRGASSISAVVPEGEWLRIVVRDHEARRSLSSKHERNPFMARGIDVFEADVDPVTRAMIDHDVRVVRGRSVYLDIETDPRPTFAFKERMRVLSWVLIDGATGEIVGEHVLAADTDDAERACLKELWEKLQPYDRVLSWSGDDFDFPVVQARTELQRVPGVDYRRWLWLDHLAAYRKMNTAAESGDEKQSMSLQAVSMSVLKEGKNDFDARKTWDVWNSGPEGRQRLLEYNRQDVRLMWRIEQASGYVELFDTVCTTTGVFGDTRGLQPTRQVDSFMLRLAKVRGEHFPTKRFYEGNSHYEGAYVMQPKAKGILRNVHVADFASLYPSIMLTWNISPDTKVSSEAEARADLERERVCISPLTKVRFDVTRKGLLPQALTQLLALRAKSNDLKASLPPGTPEWKEADRESTAYKVVANSFYGVVGSTSSRFFDPKVGESVSLGGVWLIKRTIAEAEARGMDVIYADTDSLFVRGCTETDFAAFVQWCNATLYPGILAECGCVENHVKLAYEKAFDRIVFAGKKRYAGRFIHFKGKRATKDSKPEIKGFEFKRGDTALLARRMQERIINMLMDGEENPDAYRGVLDMHRDRVVSGDLEPREVIIAKALSKPLHEYAVRLKNDGQPQAEPPHIQIARQMKQRGEEVGPRTRIEYVVVDGGGDTLRVAPAAEYEAGLVEPDRYYLWENLVYPPSQRVLEAAFPDGEDWAFGYEKVRPPKAPRRARVDEAQVAFEGFAPTERDVLVVEVPFEHVETVRRVAAQNAGALKLVLQNSRGTMTLAGTYVSGSSRFKLQLAEALWQQVWEEVIGCEG